MKRHDIIATHDLASTQALWKFNPEVAIKVAEAFRLVPSTSETTLEALLMELKKWKGDADGYRRRFKSLQAQHHEAVTWLTKVGCIMILVSRWLAVKTSSSSNMHTS